MADTRLCITVTAPTMAALRARRDRQPAGALVELRLDTVDRPDVAGALHGRPGPVVVTCRAPHEGGQFRGTEEERRGLLWAALAAGAEYVDVEYSTLTNGSVPALSEAERRRLVVSMHDFDGVPPDLERRVDAMRRTGAGTVKIAVMAHALSDVLPLKALGESSPGGAVLIAMGEAGLVSRVLASRFGSPWTYVADQGSAAPGQITAERMLGEFGFDRLRASTALYGVLGRPVAHSVSPAMHNAAFRALGIDAVYLPLPAATFDDFLRFADAFDVRGVSVTAPYKLDAMAVAVSADEAGTRTGAVNTLRRTAGGGWEGRNTDVEGFLAPLAETAGVRGRRATVLGGGGAARAVAVALRDAGALVTVSARRPDQAAAVAAFAGVGVSDWPPPRGGWDVLVNATPVGTAPALDDSPLDAKDLDGGLVYDLVYNPPRTRLLADAAARGCQTIGGLEMLVAQAQAQSAWWTGVRPAAEALRSAALTRLEEMHTL